MNKLSFNKINAVDKFDFIQDGSDWFLTFKDKIFLTPNGNKVFIPNKNIINFARLQFRDHKIAIEISSKLIEILMKFADKSYEGKGIYVDEFIKYLETDLLFYRVISPNNLAKSQSVKWNHLINLIDSTFKTSWNISTCVMPLEQEHKSVQEIKGYLIGLDKFKLHVMSYILKATGSCIVTVLCNLKKIDAMEAWEAVYVEEIWYNNIYNDPEKDKELNSKMSEIDLYFNLLSCI